jgi:hypothetical protein
MDTKSFSEVRRRVVASLQAKQIIALQSEVNRRISNDPLHFLDGSSVTDSAKFKIFKHSLISIFPKRNEDAEYNLAIHLVRLMLDYTAEISASTSMVEEKLGSNQPTVDITVASKAQSTTRTEPSRTSSSRKQRKAKKVTFSKLETTSEMDTSQSVDVDIPPPIKEQIEQAKPESAGSLVPEQPQDSVIEIPSRKVESEDNSAGNTSQKSKKRRTRVIRSATPGTPEHKEFASKRLHLDPRCDVTDISVEDSWRAIYRDSANQVHARDMETILGWSPREIGITCRARTIGQCYYCIKAYLTYPITSCEAMNCTVKQHHSVFVHKVTEYDINDFHADKEYDVNLLYKLMLQKKIMPSYHYIMLHDGNSKRLRSDIQKTLDKTVGYYFELARKS